GPVQAKFTPKELRELGTLPGWQPHVDPAALVLNDASQTELTMPGFVHAPRNLDILRGFAQTPTDDGRRALHLHFHRAPVALSGATRVERIELEAQALSGEPGAQSAAPTGERLSLPAGLVLRSVGYRGTPLPGLPFDLVRGALPHRDGRIIDTGGKVLRGWYATGWIKRGPTGVIGTNRADSVDTVASLLADLAALDAPKAGRTGLLAQLSADRRRVVDFAGWRAIEQAEAERGRAGGKPAEKFVRVEDMLDAAALAGAPQSIEPACSH
ncbi:MAG: NADP oxidoreductase, partial [Methyloversatilis discipulorum]